MRMVTELLLGTATRGPSHAVYDLLLAVVDFAFALIERIVHAVLEALAFFHRLPLPPSPPMVSHLACSPAP